MYSSNSKKDMTGQEEQQRIDDAWAKMLEQLYRTPLPSQPMARPQNQYIPQHTGESEAQRQQDLEDWRARAGGQEYLERVKTHFSRGQSFICQLCGEKFASPKELHNHLSTAHPPPRKYVCPRARCGKAFERDFQLANHVKFDHSDGHDMNQYKCKECQRNFASVRGLNLHQAPRTCPHCRKEFRCERVLSMKNHNCGFMA